MATLQHPLTGADLENLIGQRMVELTGKAEDETDTDDSYDTDEDERFADLSDRMQTERHINGATKLALKAIIRVLDDTLPAARQMIVDVMKDAALKRHQDNALMARDGDRPRWQREQDWEELRSIVELMCEIELGM